MSSWKPTPKRKSELSSPIRRVDHGEIWIFDTAAGRLVGTVGRDDGDTVTLFDPAVLTFVTTKDTPHQYEAEFAPIIYARDMYFVSWSGVRGSVQATDELFDAYMKYVAESNTDVSQEAGGTA